LLVDVLSRSFEEIRKANTRMFRPPSTKEFERRIREHLKDKEAAISLYLRYVMEASQIESRKIEEKDVKRVIGSFLLKWGRMSRVLKHPRRIGWERLLAVRLREIAGILDELKEKDLAKLKMEELDGLAEDIKRCYLAFRKILGPTSAGKALHILAPNFFPLWDARIRSLYGIKQTDERAYFRFIQTVKKLWFFDENLRECLEGLEKEFKISKLRLIDIYCWLMAREDRF